MRNLGRLLLLAWALAVVAGCGGKKPKYPSCAGDKDCQLGEKCVNKKCVQCRADADCGPGKRCNAAGGCEPIPGWCGTDADCTDGMVCKANQCVACSADAECGPGGRCQAGKCLKPGACTTDEDCPEDQDCVAGLCTAAGASSGTAKCKLEPIYFGFDQYTLTDEAKATLQKDYECLTLESARKVAVNGHTDPRGTVEYNISLSDDRAQAVITYLTRLGVEAARLRKVPKGASEARGSDEASYGQDRRVELAWE